jgi:periplasmic divalent cation tolerance protein
MRLVLCNCPPDRAAELAEALVAERLAACVNILPSVTSVYRWEGRVAVETEHTLLIKTSAEAVAQLVPRLSALHPYDVPEIVVVPVDDAASAAAYVTWVRASCAREDSA